MLLPWLFPLAVLAVTVGYIYRTKRRQNAANAPGWALLAPSITGTVKGNGVRGTFRGRAVSAWQYSENVGSSEAPSFVQRFRLRLGAGGVVSPGRSWTVDWSGPEPRHVSGDEAVWQAVLAGVGPAERQAAGFQHLAFAKRKGELTGTMDIDRTNLSWSSDLKELSKIPPPPSPEQFAARLDFSVRVAEANQSLNVQA